MDIDKMRIDFLKYEVSELKDALTELDPAEKMGIGNDLTVAYLTAKKAGQQIDEEKLFEMMGAVWRSLVKDDADPKMVEAMIAEHVAKVKQAALQ